MTLAEVVKLWEYALEHHLELLALTQEHLLILTAIPIGLAIVVGVPLGIIATRVTWSEGPIMGTTSTLQTIPSLALLAFMLAMGLGLGNRSAIVALFLYALLPIVRNTFTGIQGVDPAVVEAARGMGMTDFQRLYRVEFPLAFPVVMAGIRTSTVMIIGTATLAALIGGGGLGGLILSGLKLIRPHLILAGAVPAALLAWLAEWGLGRLEDMVTPRGLKLE